MHGPSRISRGRGTLLASVLTAALGLMSAARLAAQTTRPAVTAPTPASNWDATIKSLARGLAESNAALLVEAMGDAAQVQAFDGRGGDAIGLLARTARGTLLAAKGYVGLPTTFAADLSAAASSNAGLPADIQRRLILRDEVQVRQANSVGGRWIAEVLGVKEGEPVGVIAFWCDHAATGAANANSGGCTELVFILVKGETTADGAYHIRNIVFGDATAGR